MDEEEIVNLEQCLQSLKELIKVKKEVIKKSDKYRDMDIWETSSARRAAASDALTRACESRDKKEDDLHADLVDADLCDPKSTDSYETRIINVSCGLGHSMGLKYTPKLPKKMK